MASKSASSIFVFNRAISKGSWGDMVRAEPGSGNGGAGIPGIALHDSEPRSARPCEYSVNNTEYLASRADRTCECCNKRLSAYNNGEVCYSCEDKQRDEYHATLDRKVEVVLAKRALQERKAAELTLSGISEVFA